MQPTLVVLAAGMGSRYGGLKQIDPVGPDGKIILDYAIDDAIAAAFGRVVFVIRRDIEAAFRQQIGERYANRIACDYVYQQLETLPHGYTLPVSRQKPWGTGHALLACAQTVTENFCVINADDYYGTSAYRQMAAFLTAPTRQPQQFAMVGFALGNTLSPNGAVSRGICTVDAQMQLQSVREHQQIRRGDDQRIYGNVSQQQVILADDALCSMNYWGFSPSLFAPLQRLFAAFLDQHRNDDQSEFYLPSAIDQLLRADQITVQVMPSNERWLGITYADDKATVAAALAELPRNMNQGNRH